MNVRRATEADLAAIEALWRAFEAEVPPPAHQDVDLAEELREIAAIVRGELAFVAERDGGVVGFALARRRGARVGHLTDLYVTPDARRAGTAAALVGAVAEALVADGAEQLTLEVQAGNGVARGVYARWGFRESLLELVAPLDALRERLAQRPSGRTFGSIHIQSDDLPGIERAVRQFVPRLPGGSRGSVVAPPRNGWIAVYDDVCERDPRQLRRLAQELGERTGAPVLALGVEEGAVTRYILFEGGRLVDEYLSIQEYYGPLPPGDVVALAANPRVVARLTGADPAAVRAAAVHGASPAELPPAEDVLAAIASAIGVEGADHGWSDAPAIPGAVAVGR
ncbi:MAG TPA: GNAT family N-acetyltransferase [Gaiellaceae bacterium]|nr:GNAT family N-acetyltransferase [Gaiellaceae bacterium]